MKKPLTVFLLLVYVNQLYSVPTNRSFIVDYDANTFMKDGKPFRYISGSMHYFRIPYQYWEDRLYKARKAGLNAIETYVAWNLHEMFKGKYAFEDQNDIVKFIQLAQHHDLLVILRPGPYICAEWEYGGFPYWLVNSMDRTKIRTSDSVYLSLVDEWFSELMKRIKPLLYSNGGPIITVQIENEYGSFGCDHDYMIKMQNIVRKYLGEDVVLFTTDGAGRNMVNCGTLPSLYTTVDFGPGGDVSAYFNIQRELQNKGPLVNSEFYTGWLDHWGEKHHRTQYQSVVTYLDKILALNASVNLYMFHGGTNFNFMNGANWGGFGLEPITSSYDYDAPLSEAGDLTEKYLKIQQLISKYQPIPPGPQPQPTKKEAYGKIPISLDKGISLFDFALLLMPYKNTLPLSFEDINLAYGYLWYQTNITGIATADDILDLGIFHDRASVYVNREYQGTLNSNYGCRLVIRPGNVLNIIVENEGRVGYSAAMLNSQKGILKNVTLNGKVLTDWTMYPFGFSLRYPPSTFMSTIRKHLLQIQQQGDFISPPAIYTGVLKIQGEASDTFVKLDNWQKGFIAINNCIQKYWTPPGPQKTIFIPRTCLTDNEDNQISIIETERIPAGYQAYIEFVDEPVFV